jgi:hypothetical protein
MNDPTTDTDQPPQAEPVLYTVAPGTDDCAVCEGETLPRRPGHGERGVLLVDRPRSLVYLLDADDTARVFRGRERRPLVGDPADLNPPRNGTDHVVRAAIESAYDVIAAPWAGGARDQVGQVIT